MITTNVLAVSVYLLYWIVTHILLNENLNVNWKFWGVEDGEN